MNYREDLEMFDRGLTTIKKLYTITEMAGNMFIPVQGKNMLDSLFTNKNDVESEIEMARILNEFIMSNEHLFSDGVLAAAKKLLEEIMKLEAQ